MARIIPMPATDDKRSLMEQEKGRRIHVSPGGRHRPVVIGFAVVAVLYLLWSSVVPVLPFLPTTNRSYDAPSASKALVPFEAHIMSKCSDARDCLKAMVLPTMQRVHDKVDFTLSYIGTPTDNDGVACVHGPAECMGNIVELCAASLYPDPKLYLGFTMCISNEYEDIPERGLVEECALEHGLDFAKLNECAARDDGGFGMGLLRDSVRRSIDAGVTKSCTVRLDNEIYCVRDDGDWKDCPHGPGVNDLVIAIEKLYRSS